MLNFLYAHLDWCGLCLFLVTGDWTLSSHEIGSCTRKTKHKGLAFFKNSLSEVLTLINQVSLTDKYRAL